MRHVNPDNPSRLSDFPGSEEAIKPGTGSQIKDRVPFMNRRMGKRVPASEAKIPAIRTAPISSAEYPTFALICSAVVAPPQQEEFGPQLHPLLPSTTFA
jgi:hypothetical protein